MNKIFFIILWLIMPVEKAFPQNIFSVESNKTHLNGKTFQVVGLRCSNALLSDNSVNELIEHLDLYRSFGINTVSVYFMGSRYSNINGYKLDGSLKKDYTDRMAMIIKECDRRNMVVLVGILYWGAQISALENAYYKDWDQHHVNEAIRNTVQWLKINDFRNILIDPDNEGMAERGAGFNIAEMICEGKKVDPAICIGYNGQGYPPPCADLAIHFGKMTPKMPYIESEGTPGQYWGEYSKENGLDHYINVGIYTPGKKEHQIKKTEELLSSGHGYMFASTWLQNVPPNYDPGGDGSPCNPGIQWWLEFIKDFMNEKNTNH